MSEFINPNKYAGKELEYLTKILHSESWSSMSGSWVHELEDKFARKFGVNYAVAFNSGTSTLHAALEAVGVKAGDEVITPALSVIMDTSCILHCNAIPVYADCDPDTFNIDVYDIARKLTDKTKAIIVVSLFGLPPYMHAIMALAAEHGIPVIEDNAQCMLSTSHGKLSGTLGDIASYSFENAKHMSCGEGGMIITNNEAYAAHCRKIGGHGYKNLTATEGQIRLNADTFQHPDYKRHSMIGWNYRMPEFNAGVALAQFERIDELVDLRVRSAKLFIDAIGNCSYLKPQVTPPSYTNSYYTLGVVYDGLDKIGVSWEDFRKEYIKNGGDGFYGACAIAYTEPAMVDRTFVDRCPWVYSDVKYDLGLCPVAESLQPKLMQFKTNYRDLALAQVKADALRETIKKYAK